MIKILAVILTVISFSYYSNNKNNNVIQTKEKIITQTQQTKLTVPKDVKAVFDKSCVACHSNSGNMAKMHVNFDKIYSNSYSAKALNKKLLGIKKTIEKNSMPTKRFLKKFPDKNLSDKEKKIVIDWINSVINK